MTEHEHRTEEQDVESHDGFETGHATPEGEQMTGSGSTGADVDHTDEGDPHEGLEIAETTEAGRKMTGSGSEDP